MKNLIVILATTLISVTAFAQKNIEVVEIKTSAVCDMCKERIENQLAFTKGVTAADLVVESGVVTVSFKSNKTTIEDIREAINEIGYDADESPAKKEAYENLHHCCKKDSH